MASIAVHSSQEPNQPQMVRPLTLLALMDEASKHTHQICSTGRKKKSKNQERQKREHRQQPQAQQNDTSAHTAPHQANRNTQPPPQGQQQYSYQPPPPPPQQVPQHSQIVVQQDPGTAAVLRQMAQLHQQHFETSQTQTKALKNIASASSFTSTVGCIPIYNRKDKDACTEWLQRCKEASYYMGYNLRSALLQRSSQDMAKVIRSPDKELSHDKLIEEIMCAFSGILSTAAAIDELSCIHQQPGQNLLIYINKYRDHHWWCTKKLPCVETYKLTLSQFCSSLQDPIVRKLCNKLWDERECHKPSNLQKCLNEATRA